MRLNSDDGAENKLMDIASDARRHMYTTSQSLVKHQKSDPSDSEAISSSPLTCEW